MHLGVGVCGGPGHTNFYEFRGPLTVAHHLLGEVQHHRFQSLGKSRVASGIDARRSGGTQKQAVRGRGVAVHGDAVEGAIRLRAQHRLQRRLFDLCVGEDIDQHRCHLGCDHAGPFGNPSNRDCFAVNLDLRRGPFREGVSSHDRPRRVLDGVAAETGFQRLKLRHDAVMGQRFADHAG